MQDEAAISDGPHIIRRRAPDPVERGGRGRVGYQRPRASIIVDDGARVPDGPDLACPVAPHALQRVAKPELSVSGHAAGALPMDDDGRCAVASAVPAEETDQPYVGGATAPDCRSAVLRIEMVPADAVVMPQISNAAVRGPDIVGGVPPNCPSAAVVVEAGGCPGRACPMVCIRLPGAEPHVARSVHPESGRAGPRRPPGVRKGIPVLPVPPQDGRVACEPHVSRTAPPDNRESLSRGNGNDSPGPRTTDVPGHASAIAGPKREWEEHKQRTQRGCAEHSRASAAKDGAASGRKTGAMLQRSSSRPCSVAYPQRSARVRGQLLTP